MIRPLRDAFLIVAVAVFLAGAKQGNWSAVALAAIAITLHVAARRLEAR